VTPALWILVSFVTVLGLGIVVWHIGFMFFSDRAIRAFDAADAPSVNGDGKHRHLEERAQ
jgi:hypothetical protein